MTKFQHNDLGRIIVIPGLYDPPSPWRWWFRIGMNPTRRTYWRGTYVKRRIVTVNSPTQIIIE